MSEITQEHMILIGKEGEEKEVECEITWTAKSYTYGDDVDGNRGVERVDMQVSDIKIINVNDCGKESKELSESDMKLLKKEVENIDPAEYEVI